MQAQLTQISPLVHIRRRRKLKRSGDLLVRSGQKVSSGEPIAETVIPTRHYLVDVYRSLRLSTIAEAHQLINRKVDDVLEKDDIIAETGGLFSRVIRTPGPGRIISIQNGRVMIEAETCKESLLAGMSGMVTEIIPSMGAVIDTDCALLQGVWGNEKVGHGVLKVTAEMLASEMSKDFVSVDDRGRVIAAGYCSSKETLDLAINEGIAGLIFSSMSAALVPYALEIQIPLILLGGFGRLPFDRISAKLLSSCNGRDTSLMACRWDRLEGNRPEVIVSLPADGDPYPEEVQVQVGQTVRVHAGTRLGQVGVITRMLPGLNATPSGIRCACAGVKFQNEEIDIVPLVNLDIINLIDVTSDNPMEEENHGTD